MIDTVRKLLALFDASQRRRLAGVMATVIGMGLFQVAGVGSIVPFISLLNDRSLAQENEILAWFYDTLGFASTDGFLIFIGVVVIALLILGNAFIIFATWLMTRFAWDSQLQLSVRLMTGYLAQPYEAFLNRNSADIGKNILMESQQFANGVLMPTLKIVAFGINVLFIGGLLFALNPALALLVLAVFGVAYLAVYLIVRRPLARIGRRRMATNTQRFKAVNQGFGSVKEAKVLSRESDFIARYKAPASAFADCQVKNSVLGEVPRYGIEAIAFGLVMALFLYFLVTHGSVRDILPLAGAFALGGYRMLPALQKMYKGFSALRFNRPVLETVYRDLVAHGAAADDLPARPQPMAFKRELRVEEATYSYPHADAPALDGINITIPRNAFVAFVGATGSGKTTLADVVLGLLVPQEGRVTVDDIPINEANRRAWRANLGYVPQEIFLTDDTVAANIAYGVPPDERDEGAVERAARIACIHDFITDMPKGYKTVVGERGVRLSGGQRQRIGIARALYHDPQVLVLDEATSALDNDTERYIVEELEAMRGGRTLIVIAHRLSTVQRCNNLCLLDGGSVVAQGDYHELSQNNAAFRNLTNNQTETSAN